MTTLSLPFPLSPADQSGITHFARYGKGGYYSVSNKEELEAIPESRLEEGTMVHVCSENTSYRWKPGTGWDKLTIGTVEGLSVEVQNRIDADTALELKITGTAADTSGTLTLNGLKNYIDDTNQWEER